MRNCRFGIIKILSLHWQNALNCTLPRWNDKENRTNMHWAQQLYESLGNFPMPWCTLSPPPTHWLLSIFDSKRPWATKRQPLRAKKLHQTTSIFDPSPRLKFLTKPLCPQNSSPPTNHSFYVDSPSYVDRQSFIVLMWSFLKCPLTIKRSTHTTVNHPLTQSQHIHNMCEVLLRRDLLLLLWVVVVVVVSYWGGRKCGRDDL